MFPARFFQRTVVTEGGALDIAAEIVVHGNTFWLRKVSIFPEDPDREIVSVGAGILKRLLKEFEDEAKRQGYTFLRISALRISGRNPDRKIDILRRLR